MTEANVDTTSILDQLEKILQSPAFEIASTKSAFLEYVVKETLEGRKDDIKAYAIAVDGLGLEESFDPQTDSRIRVLGVRLREALAEYYEGEGRHDPVVITLPPRSYAPVFKRNGQAYFPKEDAPQNELSVMVCPFTYLASDLVQASISTYIAEELNLRLGLFPELTVLPCYNEVNAPPRDPLTLTHGHTQPEGHKPARFLIQGNILQEEDAVHIYTKLIDTHLNRQLWARRFDDVLTVGSLRNLQNTVIRETIGILGGVAGKLLGVQARPAPGHDSPEAAMSVYTSLFRQTPNIALFEKIETALERALARAPLNATLHCMFAHQYIAGYFWGFYADDAVIKKAEDHIAKALMAEPDNAFARLMNAFQIIQSGHLDEARQEIEAVRQKNENDVFLTTLSGYFLFMMGDFDLAVERILTAEKINPFMARYNQIAYFHNHLAQGEYEKALEAADRFYIPGFFWSHLLRAVALGLLGRKERARKAVEKLVRLRPDFPANYIFYLFYLVPPSGPSQGLFIKGLEQAGLGLRHPATNT